MPHKCLKCHTIYSNDSPEILKGCSKCNNRSFFYLKKMPEKNKDLEISKEKKSKILKELATNFNENEDKPIIIEVGSVDVIEQGKYEIDINKLMRKEDEKVPIYRVGTGTYILDINYLNE